MNRHLHILQNRIPAGLLFFILFLSPLLSLPLQAEIALLPFRISGSPDDRIFSMETLPVDMQEAAAFIMSISKRYPLQNTLNTRTILSSIPWRPEQLLDDNRAKQICSRTNSSYLLSGALQFITKTKIYLTSAVYSCSAGKKIADASRSGDIDQLQKLLRSSILEVTPFAGRAAPLLPFQASQTTDLAILLDCSGSMNEDIPFIKRGLASLEDILPLGSRMGIMALENGNGQSVFPFNENIGEAKKFLFDRKAFGDVHISQLLSALQTIGEYRSWKGKKELLIFTDATVTENEQDRLQNRLRNLISKGISVHIYSLRAQKDSDRKIWLRISRSLRISDPSVYYALRAGFIDGSYNYFVQHGSQLYRSDSSIETDIINNEITQDKLIPVNLLELPNKNTSLTDIPKLFAEKRKTRVVNISPLISGLEKKIVSDIHIAGNSPTARYKILLKNRDTPFWIQVESPNVFEQFQKFYGQKFYVGLRFQKSSSLAYSIVNHPESIYLRKQGETPLLFVNHYERLRDLPPGSLNGDDIWFLLVEIKGYRDINKDNDIRE